MPKPNVFRYCDAVLTTIVPATLFAILPRSVFVLIPTSERIVDVIQLLHSFNQFFFLENHITYQLARLN